MTLHAVTQSGTDTSPRLPRCTHKGLFVLPIAMAFETVAPAAVVDDWKTIR